MRRAVQICRHGARAPSHLFPFSEGHWPEKQLGQLTHKGAIQQFKLGEQMRRRYINQRALLQTKFDPEEVRIVTTLVRRAKLSAACQMMGMFRQEAEQALKMKLSSESFPPIPRLIGSGAMTIFPLRSDNALLKNYSPNFNPAIKGMHDMARSSTEFLHVQEQWRNSLFARVGKALGIDVQTINIAGDISSAIDCEVAANYKLPAGIDKQSYKELQRVHAYEKFNIPFALLQARVISFAPLFRDILQTFESETSAKFTLYSAHDTTVAGVLSCLGWVDSKVPGFASTLIFELDSSQTVRCFFNNKPLTGSLISFPCSLQQFSEALKAYSSPSC